MSVAETILSQLGGNKFLMMTGCHHLVSDKTSLRMQIPRNASKANRCQITLDADDTYTVDFYRFTPGRLNMKTLKFTADKVTPVYKVSGLYCDQLREIFTRITGMHTRL